MANRTQLQAALQKPYNRQLFAKDVLSQVFGAGLSVYNIPAKAPVQPTKSEAAVIGNVNIYAAIQLEDGTDITCYEIELQPGKRIEQNKVAIQQYVRKLLTAGQAALVNFISPENPVTWRLTLIAKDSEITGTGIEERTTHAKRYTYLLGSAQSCYTAAQRLAELGNKTAKGIGLKDLTDAFSVAVLTKEFYNELFQWYQWTLTEEVGITFPKNTSITEDDREKLEEQVIRLITRLLFVWFIKQKQLVPSGLFNAAELKKVLKSFNPESATNGNYYNAILQNLFFATLNKAVNERAFAKEAHKRDIKTLYRYTEMFSISEKEVLELFRPIPFLNGGLFECLDKEDLEGNKYFLDGFSRNDTKMKGHFKHRAFIPNCVFFDEQKGIIPLLERYNFTVEENSPEDVQVALDPELLGNVFENLLGVYNPETKESARKQSGSFYTPREIVSFMVSESLIAYLTNACPQLKPDTVRSLFENEALPEELQGKEQLCKDVSGKLKAVKILDPACGSGAFPMGILKKMVEVLDKLDLKNIKTVYEQKLHLIEECIYGVDIQTIAAQISKLRFFISLICEQEEMDLSKPGENYGVITLPNLETKFVAANTLIGLHKKPAQTNLFEDPRIETVKKEILAIRHEHFYAKTTDKKKQLREKDEKLRAELVKLLAANGDFAPEDAKQLAQWNPYDQNTSSPFFDTEWMFGLQKEKGLLNTTAGYFDIVIGNPPYVDIKGMAKNEVKLFFKLFDTAQNRINLYSFFIEKGISLLKSDGILTYINPNSILINESYKKIRQLLIHGVEKIIKLPDFVFTAATVETIILITTKKSRNANVMAALFSNNAAINFKQLNFTEFSRNDWMQDKDVRFNIFSNDKINSFLLKIEKDSIPLEEFVFTSLGITPYDKYKGHTNEMIENKVFHAKKKLSNEYVPLISGKDIHRYYLTESSKEYLKYGNWLGASRERKFFESPKIMVRQILDGKELSIVAAYSESPKYFTQIGFSLISKPANKTELKFLLCLINSSLICFYHKHKFLDKEKIIFQKILIANCKRLPVKVSNNKNRFISLVDKIISAKHINSSADTSKWEKEIDIRVYHLYSLTFDEAKLIDETLTEQEFNRFTQSFQ